MVKCTNERNSSVKGLDMFEFDQLGFLSIENSISYESAQKATQYKKQSSSLSRRPPTTINNSNVGVNNLGDATIDRFVSPTDFDALL